MRKLTPVLLCWIILSCVDTNDVFQKDPHFIVNNDIEEAKAWFQEQQLTNKNLRTNNSKMFDKIDWGKSIQIKESKRILFEIPLQKLQKESFRQGLLETGMPLMRKLLITKNAMTKEYSYSILEFIPKSEYLFTNKKEFEKLSIKDLSTYYGLIILKDLSGQIINGFVVEKGILKKGINKGNQKSFEKNKSQVCMSFTVNYFVDVCSQYGCFSSFDFSQTYNFCFDVTYENELASVEPSDDGYGGGPGGIGEPTITPIEPYPTRADLHARLGQSFENDFARSIQNLNGQFCGYQLNQLKDHLFANYGIDLLQDDPSVLNYPQGHPHNREYIYGFGILIGKGSNPLLNNYDYNGDYPTFEPDSPYGAVTNPGRHGLGPIKIKTCEGDDEWWIAYHFFIKETI